VKDLHAEAVLAADLVREAGRLALELRAGDLGRLRVGTKPSISDLVTAADHAAERLVVDHLAAFRPDDAVLGEEGGARPGTSGRTWVIDPVDGTYNFVRGLDSWCSAIALHDGDPGAGAGAGAGSGDVLLGAVYHPTQDALYVGGPGLATMRDGEEYGPIVDRPLAECCVATYLHPPSFGGPTGAAFTRVVRGAATLRMLGSSSVDLAAVSQGRLDLFLHHSAPPWDWLPGSALVRGAGGAARRVTVDGTVWSVAGAPTAVAEACAALVGA
jgi:fructose-1,6-bisphosphatase/inositol monophosphatase family enzyme